MKILRCPKKIRVGPKKGGAVGFLEKKIFFLAWTQSFIHVPRISSIISMKRMFLLKFQQWVIFFARSAFLDSVHQIVLVLQNFNLFYKISI